MFHFLKKKKVDQESVRSYNEALKYIGIFIKLSQWEKWKKAISEIKKKEADSLSDILEHLNNEKEGEELEKAKTQLDKEFQKKKEQLLKLENDLLKKERIYRENELKARFKIRFKKIKSEIDNLTKNSDNSNALNILQTFLEENKERPDVIKFYNKEKKIIQNNIRKNTKKEEEKIKKNARLEALKLIWETVHIKKKEVTKEKKLWLIGKWREKLDFKSKIKEAIKRKRLEQEINILIEEDSKVEQDVAARKLANIHKWLIKEINNHNILGYELYGKILWADKISWDTFGFQDFQEKYNFFLGDATGHGIRAWFIVTLLSRLFNQFAKNNSIGPLTYEINNGLKQDLKSRNFITWIFFEINKKKIEEINYVGMWHEPMLIYRNKTKTIEKIIPGGLAAGIRLIKSVDDVKVKKISLDDKDILLTYSDGIIESKNPNWEFYSIDKLSQHFEYIASIEWNINKIYEYLIKQVQLFRWGSQFDDDSSILILKRDSQKDIVDKDSEYLKNISIKEGLKKREIKKLEWKSKEVIEWELLNIKKEKEIDRIIKVLSNLYYTWEILRLKQEAIRYIKDGYISPKINFYLRKAIDNEKKYKIEQKEQKIKNKYNVLCELLKKWDYSSVITETEDIIAKDWNI